MQKECCDNCKYGFVLDKWDYSKKGVPKTIQGGVACSAVSDEGAIIWMSGIDPSISKCEMWKKKLFT